MSNTTNEIARIGAGAGIGMISDGINRMFMSGENERATRRSIEASKELTDHNFKKQLELWDATGYGAQRKQMEDAGLSVGMMYGGGGQGGSTNLATGSSSGGGGAPTSGLMGGIEAGLQASLQQAQIENIKADTKKKEAETTGVGLQNTWEQFLQNPDLNAGGDGTPLKETGYRVDINERRSRIEKMDKEMQKMGIDMSKGKAEIERIKTDIDLQKQLKEYREKMNPMELEKFEKELEVYKQNPANNEVVQWIETILGMGGKLIGLGK